MSPHKNAVTPANYRKHQSKAESANSTEVSLTRIGRVITKGGEVEDENFGSDFGGIGGSETGSESDDFHEEGFCIPGLARDPSGNTNDDQKNEFVSFPSLPVKAADTPISVDKIFGVLPFVLVPNAVNVVPFTVCGGFDSNGNPLPSFANWLVHRAIDSGKTHFFTSKKIRKDSVFYAVDHEGNRISKEHTRRDGSLAEKQVALILMFSTKIYTKEDIVEMLGQFWRVCKNLRYNRRPIHTNFEEPTGDCVLTNASGLGRFISCSALVELVQGFYPNFTIGSRFLAQNKAVRRVVGGFYPKGTWTYEAARTFGIPLSWMSPEALAYHRSQNPN